MGEASLFIALPSTVAAAHIYTHTPADMSDVRVWTGRDSAALGDSMSTGSGGWTYQLAAWLGCTHIQYTANGRRMYQALLNGAGVALTQASFTGKSYVTMLLGVNDAAQNTQLGTIADLAPVMSPSYSYYGNLRCAIETLIGWNDSMNIVLCTPIYNPTLDGAPNAAGFYLEDYRNAIRAVATKYAIPLLDFAKVNQLNAVNFANWSSDGTHPKDVAAYTALMANPAKGFFRSLYPRV
jgi:lysophospholipase L1-like esterase